MSFFKNTRSVVTVLFVASLFVLSAPVYASDPLGAVCTANPGSTVCDTPTASQPLTGPYGVFNTVISLIGVAVGIISVFAIIIYGFMFITSSGDSQKVARAKNGIIYAVIGIVVALIARVIASFVLTRL